MYWIAILNRVDRLDMEFIVAVLTSQQVYRKRGFLQVKLVDNCAAR
jgi:hypothetical protein